MATNPSASSLDRHGSPAQARGQVPGMAIASFVLGIIAILTAVLIVPGLICGIVGLVLGLTARGNAKRGGPAPTWQATAGVVLNGLAILAVVGIFVAAAA